MPTYIYSRVSTDRQENSNQIINLKQRYPEAEIVEETQSGAKNRPNLDALISRMQKGDTIVVAALDRLGRRCGELVMLLDQLTAAGINVVSLREGIDLSTISGTFIAQMFCAMAQMERAIIIDRTKSALRAKRESGVRLGRPRKFNEAVFENVRKMREQGATHAEIAEATGVSVARVGSFLRAQ